MTLEEMNFENKKIALELASRRHVITQPSVGTEELVKIAEKFYEFLKAE